jgi:putative exporter of polyketide antibiotics
MDNETISATGAKIAYSGGGAAFLFGMTANEVAAIGGLIIGAIGLIIQLVFKIMGHLELKRHHKKVEEK